MLRLRSAAGLAAGVLIALTGCSSGGSGGAEKTLQVPDEPRESIRSEYRGWRADDAALYDMEERLIAACMSDGGFTYTPELTDASDTFDPLPAGSFEISSDQARSTGYPPAPGDAGDGGDVEPADLQGLSSAQREAWQAAYQGSESEHKTVEAVGPGGSEITMELGGCRLRAVEQLYGSLDSFVQSGFTNSNLATFALSAAGEDEAMRRLDGEWAECMSASGYSQDADGEALARPESAQSLAVDRPAEAQSIALSDAQCQEKLSYARKRLHIEDRYLTAVADMYESEITGTLDIKRTALGTGRKLLG